ncbi:MAG: VacJ family lipoprotein [Deltaproteobacteria bacterium]|nr:VacJ family lipoprotein [Deltaproteobacteria bacterium]
MKRSVLFSVILLALLVYTTSYSADSLLLPSSGSMHPESSIGFPGHASNYLILANGMPQDEAPEDPSAKDRSTEDKESEEGIETSEDISGSDDDLDEAIEGTETINDPWEPFNRTMFTFNDKVYFYCLKPAARGYRAVLPKKARISIRKFFSNVSTPGRMLNCALQGKVKGVVTEPTRFVINTTVGIVGLFDPALSFFHIKKQEVDFDQTLGRYGMKPVLYINWPLLGTSSLRGTLGFIGDTAFDPATYLLSPLIKIGILAYGEVNETSLTIGEYEDLTESALDPYIAIRNAYFQNRKSKVAAPQDTPESAGKD